METESRSSPDLSDVKADMTVEYEGRTTSFGPQASENGRLAVIFTTPERLHCCFSCHAGVEGDLDHEHSEPCLGMVFDRDTGVELDPSWPDEFVPLPGGARIVRVTG